MQLKNSQLIGVLLVIGCALAATTTGESTESAKFCIRITEPLPLIDTEDHVNPRDNDRRCALQVQTLTVQEKAQFLAALCQQEHKDDYHFLKMRNGELTGRVSYQAICTDKRNPLLAWLPYDVAQKNFIHELNPKEHANYIAKADAIKVANFCHFTHSNLVSNSAEDAFKCHGFLGADSKFGLDQQIYVMVEIQPIMYEVRNITYMPWINSTASYKTRLGEAQLQNPRGETKQIFGSINYAYIEKVKLNTDSVYKDGLEKLPLLFHHNAAVLELSANGVGGVEVNKKAFFGRVMDPQSSVKVEVIGQWAEHRQQFSAEVHEYFGYGIKRYRQPLQGGDVAFVLIESTEPVFDMLDATHRVSTTLHKGKPVAEEIYERLTTQSHSLSTEHLTDKKKEVEPVNVPTGGNPYPGFFPWFLVACIVVSIVVLIACAGVVRGLLQDKNKHEYKRAGS